MMKSEPCKWILRSSSDITVYVGIIIYTALEHLEN